MNLEALLGRFQGVRRSGNGWVALCPAHADRNRSLSVCERQGKILLHCFAGCTAEAVCEALGIKLTGLFNSSAVGLLGAVTSRAEAQTMRVACIYALLGVLRGFRKIHFRQLARRSYC